MKKRLISLLLCLALTGSMVVFPVGADTQATDTAGLCPCGCGLALSQIAWSSYETVSETQIPSGHYRLSNNYAQKDQRTIKSTETVVLDLQGCTLTTQDYHRLYLIYGSLYVVDTVGGGRMMAKTKGTSYGGVVILTSENSMPSLFEMYAGVLTVDTDSKSSARGGILSVGALSTFRMYGGMITGGSTVAIDAAGESQVAQGGAIAAIAASARVEILGGTIMNCSSASDGGSIYSIGDTVLKNCRILGGTAQGNGGNICQSGGSLTMDNCEIAYGSAYGATGGGNILISGNMTDNSSIIRDGFASGGSGNGGGNIYFNKGEHTLKNTTIRGGVSRKYGANIMNWSSNAVTRLEDCTINGDVRWAGSGLTLAGKTKIGLGSNGLNLVGSSSGSKIYAGELTEGAEIFVSAAFGTFTKDAVNADYFKPALRTVLTQSADGTLGGNLAASGEIGGYCPHCYDPDAPQKVIWTAFADGVFQENCLSDKTGDTNPECTNEHLVSGHFYLSKNVENRFNVPSGVDVVIDLNGKKLSSSHRVFVLSKNACVSILDFNGAGSVTGKGSSTANSDGSFSAWNGGVVYGASAYSFRFFGGQLIYQPHTDENGNRNPDKHIAGGGVLYAPAGSQIGIYGGTVDASAYNATGANNFGGAVCMTGGTFTMTGGRILGGTANLGGSLYFDQANTLKIEGGVISGGRGQEGGGNLRLGGAASTANLKDCALVDGSAVNSGGGNINTQQAATNLDNCYIVNGNSSAGLGGNLRLGISATGIVKNTVISNGAAKRGGNIYAAATNLNMTYENCLITAGTAIDGSSATDSTGSGGNIFANNGTLVFCGGEISFGTATASGGNLYINAGNNTAGNKVVFAAGNTAPCIWGGHAAYNGGNIHHLGVAEYHDAFICGGTAGGQGQDICLGNGAKTALIWGEGVIGEMSAFVDSKLLSAAVYGESIAGTTATGMNATVYLENIADTPQVFCADGKLTVAAAAVVDGNDYIWFPSNEAAVTSCSNDQYIKLYTDQPLKLTKDLAADLQGHTVNVSGSYTLYGMDSSGDDFNIGTGKAVFVTNEPRTAAIHMAPNQRRYLSITDGNTVTYHRLVMDITHIALRPNSAGLYYTAAWNCDSAVADLITDYGIALSLNRIPNGDFKNSSDALWVSFDTPIGTGQAKCSALVNNILDAEKSAVQNQENAELPIYATAYITLSDGTTYVSDLPGTGDDILYSLHSFMQAADELIETEPLTYRHQEKALQAFYDRWLDNGMAQWQFNRLNLPPAEGPLCDGKTLKILAMTSSFGLNTTQLLYDIAKAEGCENVTVARLYSSGCTLQQHVKNLSGNLPGYQYTKNDSGTWVYRENTTLEYGLLDEDWDIIFIQQGAAQAALADTYGNYLDIIFDYLEENKTNPYARYIWNMTWAYQGDSDQKVFVETFKSDQMAMYNSILNAVQTKIVGRTEFSAIIPSGTAIQNARTSYFGDTLTKDTYHLNNLGRAIAGYTLWATITGKPLTQVNLGPVNSPDLPAILELSDTDRLVILDAVNKAIAKPFEVTPSAYPTK